MRIISREEWGARHDRGFAPAPLPAQRVYLHHSVTIAPDLLPPFTDDDAAVRRLEEIGEERFGGGISYTHVVTPVGRIYEGHGVDRRGAHTAGQNSTSRAVCWIGDYERQFATWQQVEATAWLLAYGAAPARRWWTAPRLAGGHRDAPGASTACPGRNAVALIPEINRLAAGLPAPAWKDDDMPTAQEVADAILDTPIARAGDELPHGLAGGTTTLRNELAWMTNSFTHGAWWAPGAGAAVARRVDAVAAAVASTPEELRALRAQLARIESNLAPTPLPVDGVEVDGEGWRAELRAELVEFLNTLTVRISTESKGTP